MGRAPKSAEARGREAGGRFAARPYWTRRIARQAVIATFGIAGSVVVGWIASDKDSLAFRASLGTGYVSLALLAWSLAIGPIRLLSGRRSPPSTDLRRDVGVSAAIFALLHVVTGLQVHMRGAMWKYFVDPQRAPRLIVPRLDSFGLANHAGLAATAILVLLLVISNDVAIRRLGVARWKRIQKWNYLGGAFVVLHGVAYLVVDRRSAGFVIAFALITSATVAAQLAGTRLTRRLRRGRPPTLDETVRYLV